MRLVACKWSRNGHTPPLLILRSWFVRKLTHLSLISSGYILLSLSFLFLPVGKGLLLFCFNSPPRPPPKRFCVSFALIFPSALVADHLHWAQEEETDQDQLVLRHCCVFLCVSSTFARSSFLKREAVCAGVLLLFRSSLWCGNSKYRMHTYKLALYAFVLVVCPEQ